MRCQVTEFSVRSVHIVPSSESKVGFVLLKQ